MLWLKHRGIISVIANSVLNSNELDQTATRLLITARNDGYAQGYTECTQHVTNALKVDWDTSRSATHGVDTKAAHAAAKAKYNTLHLSVMDLVTIALQSDDFGVQLKEVFPDEEDEDEDKIKFFVISWVLNICSLMGLVCGSLLMRCGASNFVDALP
ncbi:hypothetical protein Hanom_Chr15g01401621 [Helianthus anomalus]